MTDAEKLDIIIYRLNEVSFIPAYCEDYARQAIAKALREIRAAEAEEETSNGNV